MTTEARLKELGIDLPSGVAAAANYLPAVRCGDLLFLSGQTPRIGNAVAVVGQVGTEVSLEQAREGARICATRLLAVARDTLGSLDLVDQVVELVVYVHAGPQFTEPSAVADAASDVMMAVLGPRGRHARTAVCVSQLPKGAAVEIAALFAVH